MDRLLELDHNGDVTIALSGPSNKTSVPRSVKVSSKCLTLASTVFSAMLRPNSGFLEGNQLERIGHLELTLDDNPEAMLIILKSLHHRNDMVPKNLDVAMLYDIALIADKYDLYSFLVPWAEVWMSKHRFGFLHIRYNSAELWLCIAWVFKDVEIFEKTSKQLILETTAADEELITREGKTVGEGVPDRIIDAIKTLRQTHLTTLMSSVWKEIDRYKDSKSNGKYLCKLGASAQQAQCDAMSLGAITGSLARAKLLTGTPVEVLSDVIKELKNTEKPGRGLQYISRAAYIVWTPHTKLEQPTYKNHSDCGSHTKLFELAESVEKSITGLHLSDFLLVIKY
ncbi:hypothetical protein K440DRAFT_662333 [Wilcoxina mikolae CBS 423.85]|nr:hypothetical protein K440DRAFT_662333 [Wilcoxina mikolae CBS 423.85]